MNSKFGRKLPDFIELGSLLPADIAEIIGDITEEERGLSVRDFLLARLDIETGGPGIGKCATLIELVFAKGIYRPPAPELQLEYDGIKSKQAIGRDLTAALLSNNRPNINKHLTALAACFASAYRRGDYPGAAAPGFFFKQQKEGAIPFHESVSSLSDNLRELFAKAQQLLKITGDSSTLTLADYYDALRDRFQSWAAIREGLLVSAENYDWSKNSASLSDCHKDYLVRLADKRELNALEMRLQYGYAINPFLLACASILLGAMDEAAIQALPAWQPIVGRNRKRIRGDNRDKPSGKASHIAGPLKEAERIGQGTRPQISVGEAAMAQKAKPADKKLETVDFTDKEAQLLSKARKVLGSNTKTTNPLKLGQGIVKLLGGKVEAKKLLDAYYEHQIAMAGDGGASLQISLNKLVEPEQVLRAVSKGAAKDNRITFFDALGVLLQVNDFLPELERQGAEAKNLKREEIRGREEKGGTPVRRQGIGSTCTHLNQHLSHPITLWTGEPEEALKLFKKEFYPFFKSGRFYFALENTQREILSDAGRVLTIAMEINPSDFAERISTIAQLGNESGLEKFFAEANSERNLEAAKPEDIDAIASALSFIFEFKFGVLEKTANHIGKLLHDQPPRR